MNRITPSAHADHGSQTLELAMVMPILALLLTLVVAVGQAAVGVISTHHMAGLAARLAATRGDVDVVSALGSADYRSLDITPPTPLRQPGDPVTVSLTRDVDVLWLPAPGLPATAVVTYLTEEVP